MIVEQVMSNMVHFKSQEEITLNDVSIEDYVKDVAVTLSPEELEAAEGGQEGGQVQRKRREADDPTGEEKVDDSEDSFTGKAYFFVIS